MKEKKPIKKTETIQEFLARGGVITRLPSHEEVKKKDVVRKSAAGPANLMTYDEADLYYGESKPRKAKKTPDIDLSALPEVLRKKHLAEVVDEVEEEDQEDGEA